MAKRRSGLERGAALVEAAISLTFLLVLLAGILDYGDLFGDTIDVSGAVRSAVLAGTASDTTVATDDRILSAVLGTRNATASDIERVIVYKSGSASTGPPAACVNAPDNTGPVAGCAIYMASDLKLTDAQLEALPRAQGWLPSERVAGTDYLGVWVKLSHPALTGLVTSPTHFQDSFNGLIAPIASPSDTTAPPTDGLANGTIDMPPDGPDFCTTPLGCNPPSTPPGANPPVVTT